MATLPTSLTNNLGSNISLPVVGQPTLVDMANPTGQSPTTSNQLPQQPSPGLQPVQIPAMQLTSQPLALDAINGQQFVATNAGVPQLPGAATTVNQIASQIPSGLGGPSGTQLALDMANATRYSPTGGPLDAILGINAQTQLGPRQNHTQMALDSIGAITNTDNAYLANAYRRGLEQAGARGLINSSMAGEAAQRSAIEASMPIFNQAMNLNAQREQQEFEANQATRNAGYQIAGQRETQLFQQARDTFAAAQQLEGQDRQNAFARAQQMLEEANSIQKMREQQAFQSQESQLDRTQNVNNQLLGSQLDSNKMRLDAYLQSQQANQDAVIQAQLQEREALLRQQLNQDTTLQQDWLADRNFTRQFNATLSMLPISSSMDMYAALTKYALEEPEVYTPEVISGFANFFRNDMNAMLSQYLGGNG